MSETNAVESVASSGSGRDITLAITGFEEVLLARAAGMGLPSTNVLVDVQQRVQVLNNFESVISSLQPAQRAGAVYMSKLMLAVSAGLFDAALNYLWDETITELRKRIVSYDLNYFFDLAVSAPEKRKELNTAEDLVRITDDELIRAAAKIGFISEVGQQQLDLVRFMRNFASAAHPNQHEIGPYQLLAFVETCIREVITLPQSPTMVATYRLLANIKTTTVTGEDAAQYSSLFAGIRRDQTEDLGNGLFGIYVAPHSTPVMRDNVRLILPFLWPFVPEEVRFSFGVRHARFKANLDRDQADLAREFLEVVGGAAYLPEEVRVGEIDALLDDLRRTHNAMDNFYNEPPVALKLEGFIGQLPVPLGVRAKYVKVLVEAYLGRSSGISWAADAIYQRLLGQRTPVEASSALAEITGPDHAGLFSYASPQSQFGLLLDILAPKLIGNPAKSLEASVRAFTGPKYSLFRDSRIKEQRDAVLATL